jgi:glycerate kinase
MSRRFLVAPDSFKGTFDAFAVAEAIAGGIEAGDGEADRCPVADGGEGTMAVLLAALGGERRRVEIHDPLRRPIEASFALLGDGGTAVVETAEASGLGLVAPEERDAEGADTRGSGGERRPQDPRRGRGQRHHRRGQGRARGAAGGGRSGGRLGRGALRRAGPL